MILNLWPEMQLQWYDYLNLLWNMQLFRLEETLGEVSSSTFSLKHGWHWIQTALFSV